MRFAALIVSVFPLVLSAGCRVDLPKRSKGAFVVGAFSGPTTESGDEATFTIVVGTRPIRDVELSFDSSDPSEATVATTSVVFTPENWDVPQTVTVTGVDDNAADGHQPYDIVFAPPVSEDEQFTLPDVAPLKITNTNIDDDTAGIQVGAPDGVTTESGGQATFEVVLTSEPSDTVGLSFGTSNSQEGTLSIGTMLFEPAGWNVPQTVTVTGVDDDVDDDDQTYSVVFDAVSTFDAAYAALGAPADLSLLNIDDDDAGFVVTTISGPTSETGDTATFDVMLQTRPTADVSITVTSSNPNEGTASPASLTFTPLNWNVAQSVTVSGADDVAVDGDQNYAIEFGNATSNDAKYSGQTAPDVLVLNLDNDPNASILLLRSVTQPAAGVDNVTIRVEVQDILGNVIPSDNATRVDVRVDGSALFESLVTGQSATGLGTQSVTVTVSSGVAELEIMNTAHESVAVAHSEHTPIGLDVRSQDGLVTIDTIRSDFEADDASLQLETFGTGANSWVHGAPASVPAFSGTNVWATNLSGDYNVNEVSCLRIDTVLPEGTVSWSSQVRYNVESTYDFVSFWTCPGSFTDPADCTFVDDRTGANTDYELFDHDLTALAGQYTALLWCLESDFSITHDGLYIDDIAVRGQTEGATITFTP